MLIPSLPRRNVRGIPMLHFGMLTKRWRKRRNWNSPLRSRARHRGDFRHRPELHAPVLFCLPLATDVNLWKTLLCLTSALTWRTIGL